MSQPAQFYQLTPDFVIHSVEEMVGPLTGEYLQLNSYENRVYALRLEGAEANQVIVKFYRPGRWSEVALREEHEFLLELKGADVNVVPPLVLHNGDTLANRDGIWMAAFAKARGRMPQEFLLEELTQIGRVLGRLHNVGAQQVCRHRPVVDADHMGTPALATLAPLLPPSLKARYLQSAEDIIEFLQETLQADRFQRIHGDCHRGNVLQTDEPGKPKEFFFVDFDDFGLGPVVQDMWMLFRHDEDDVDDEIDAFLSGYVELRDFDETELQLIPALRGLRILHYAAWIAKRWDDPSFPRLFPSFGSEAYWFEEMNALEAIAGSL